MYHLYNFECGKCEHEFEDLAAPNETINCPRCNMPAKQLISLDQRSAPPSAKMQELFNLFATRKAMYKGVSTEAMPYVGMKKSK